MEGTVASNPRRVLGGLGFSVALLVALLRTQGAAPYLLYAITGVAALGILAWGAHRAPAGQRGIWWAVFTFMMFGLATAVAVDVETWDTDAASWSPTVTLVLIVSAILGALALALLRRSSPIRTTAIIVDTLILAVVVVTATVAVIEQVAISRAVSASFGPILVIVPAICVTALGLLVYAMVGGRREDGATFLAQASLALGAVAVLTLWLDIAFDFEQLLATTDLAFWLAAAVTAALGATARHEGTPSVTSATGYRINRLAVSAVAIGAVILPIFLAIGLASSWTRYNNVVAVGMIAVMVLLVVRAFVQWRSLGAERSLISGLLDTVDNGVLGVDSSGVVVFANESALRILELPRTNLVGECLHDSTHHSHADGTPYPREQCTLLQAMASLKTVRVGDDTFINGRGEAVPVDVTVIPLAVSGQPPLTVVAFRDLRDRRALERRQRHFVSIVSHELRTPVTSIRGSLQLLDAGVLGTMPENQANMVRLAHRNAERLNLLVNDILDLERLDSGTLTCLPQAVDAVQASHQVVDDLAGAARIAGVRVSVRANASDATDGIQVYVDPHRLEQVLVNLIGNAIKFSEPGQCVTVMVSQDHRWVRYDVVDEGKGIPPDAVDRIFERFGQVEEEDSRSRGGTGLGLAISRELCNASGGSITVDSRLGEGTTFSVLLPRDGADQ